MKKNILMRTNILVCIVIIIGFTTTAVLSYQANYTASVQNIEQVSALTPREYIISLPLFLLSRSIFH